MQTILDQTTEADLLDFVSDLKVIAAGCQAHVGQIATNAYAGVLGPAEAELSAALSNAMVAAPEIERLLLCLLALKRHELEGRSVQ